MLLLNPPAKGTFIRDYYCSFSSKADYYWPPQDLLILSGILRNHYDIHVIDAVGLNLNKEECFKRIMQLHPSTLIFATGAASLEGDLEFVKEIDSSFKMKVIGSGGIFKFIGRLILNKHPYIEAVLTDFVCTDILDFLNGGHDRLRDIIYRREGEIKETKTDESKEYRAGIPQHELFLTAKNRLPLFGDSEFAALITSSGCKFNCKFCVAGKFKFRKRFMPEVVEEIKYLLDRGISNLFIADPLFTVDRERVLELCSIIREEDIKIKWVSNAHPATIQDEYLLRKMKDAGCSALMIGVESGDDNILKEYKSSTSRKQIKDAFVLCRKAGLKTLGYFIIGLPGEDARSINKTIEFAKELKCDYASFSFAIPDIGSDLYNKSLSQGYFNNNLSYERLDSSRNAVLKTAQLSKEKAEKLMHSAYRRFYLRPEYIWKKFYEAGSLREIKYLFKVAFQLLKKSAL